MKTFRGAAIGLVGVSLIVSFPTSGAGVTVITHGFHSNATNEWAAAMASAIFYQMNKTGFSDVTVYTIRLNNDGPNGSLQALTSDYQGTAPTATTSGEIIVMLDWSDVSSHLTLLGDPSDAHGVTTESVANLVAEKFFGEYPPSLGRPLVEFPIHFIGHSRGGSVVSVLSKILGEQGVWVDHVTFMDPHPLTYPDTGVFQDAPDPSGQPVPRTQPPDAAVKVFSNVRFSDNYWRRDPSWLGWTLGSLDFNGQFVVGATNNELVESVLSGDGYPFEHSDVHLWYHGTIDTNSAASDGKESVPASWYDGSMGPRDHIGYYYSRILAGTRPDAGLAVAGASREPITLSVSGAEVWDNVEIAGFVDDSSVTLGSSLTFGVVFEDSNRDATITVGLDLDANPYNGVGSLPSRAYRVRDLSGDIFIANLNISDVIPGIYRLYAKISNGTHTRYYYAPGKVVVPPALKQIYAQNFEGQVGSEWVPSLVSTTKLGGRIFLGEFNNDTVSLSLNNLPSHNAVRISFDLFVIQSWDGNGEGCCGEYWGLSVENGPSLFRTTFSNTGRQGNTQAFPAQFPSTVRNPEHTGAVEVNTLGYQFFGDSVYRLSFDFPHTTDSLKLNFFASGMEPITNESWGLDNVLVSIAGVEPVIVSPAFGPNGAFVIGIVGEPYQSYRVEAASDLSFTSWSDLGTYRTSNGKLLFTDSNAPSFGRRFYRAVRVP